MSKPNAGNYNPNPDYLRRLIARSDLTQREVAIKVGISERMLRHYLMNEGASTYRAAPYPVQYAIEQLALNPQQGLTMKNYFAIQLQTTNAAFTEQGLPEEELVRILNNTAERIADSIETDYSIRLKDVNGNNIGTATRLELTKKPEPFGAKLGDFNLLIECGDAAFFDDGEPSNHEIARIIKNIASDPDGLSKAGKEAKKLRDINGNTVGEVQWTSSIAPTIDPIFTALLAEADKHLGEHLDPYDALIFKDSELISFMDDHTVFNVLHGQDGDGDDFSINEIEKSVGSLFSLDASELAAAILTYQASKTTKPELMDKITNNLIDAVKSESDRFALDEEEASQIQKDTNSFKAAVEAVKLAGGDKQPATTSNEPSM